MVTGHQKVDHGGKFSALPHRLINSIAWRQLSGRAVKVLLLLQSRHNGFNNSRIAFAIHDIGRALGNQNHKSNSRAVAELIELGFLECMSDANRHHSKAREYRLTYISAGGKKGECAASNEYLEWRPAIKSRRKFGGATTATESGNCQTDSTTHRKLSSVGSGTQHMEIHRVSVLHPVAETAMHIGNQYEVGASYTGNPLSHAQPAAGASPSVDPQDLRQWLLAVLGRLGHGGQKRLSDDSGVPQPVICKFKNGRGLPDHYLLSLQCACGRILSFKDWMENDSARHP